MKIGKKIFVGIYVCLFALTIALSGVIIGFSALNGDFSSPFEVNYYTTPEILSDDYGYYVEMGEYPQTFAGYTSDVTDFTDSGEDFSYIAARYGTTATADIYIDGSGNRYIKYTVAAYSADYTFMDGTSAASGDAYFKFEPIKWRILGYYEDSAYTNAVVDGTASFVQVTSVSDENYNALVAHSDAIIVQSELALECVRWYSSSTTDIDYPDSTIYKWLENFYSNILSSYDSCISSRTIDYNDTSETSSSDYDTVAFTTSEKVWLLSYTEADGVFYSSSTARLCSPSDFGIATYCYMPTTNTSNYRTGTTFWWLRSSFLDSSGFYCAHRVNAGGDFTDDYYVYIDDLSIRPAMLLNLSGSGDSGLSASTVEILSDSYGYYVEMGEYPQTFAGYVSDVSFTDSGEEFTYVAKSGSTATADVYTDNSGNRYIIYTIAANFTSYTFMDGTSTASGDAYFKLEPIKWRILGYYEDSAHTNGVTDSESSFVQVTSVSNSNYSALVEHCDAIVVQSELGLEGVQWYTSATTDVDYPDSTIYKWLENFYSAILSGYDSYISSRTIDYNDTGETSSGQTDTAAYTTSEEVWLISYTEAITYYSSETGVSEDRCCSPSDFGLATYIYMNTNYTSNYREGTCLWWLRSSFIDSDIPYARRVNADGMLYDYTMSSGNYAVRPAMLLNLSGTDTSATATCVSSIAGMGSVGETLLNSSDSTETAILTTASVSEKRRHVLCVEN